MIPQLSQADFGPICLKLWFAQNSAERQSICDNNRAARRMFGSASRANWNCVIFAIRGE